MKEISNKNNPSTSRRQPHYVVNKRVGDIVQGDKTGDKPLSEVVKEYIKKTNTTNPEKFFLV
jgi:23S rRNA pseudouridine1911/1915/1917 synthase